MTSRKTIGTGAFIVALAAWPIVIYIAGTYVPGTVGWLVLAALIFVIGCAYVMQSSVLAGAIVGLLISFFFGFFLPQVNWRPELGDVVFPALLVILGAFVGEIVDLGRKA